jgi:hypothetical protein
MLEKRSGKEYPWNRESKIIFMSRGHGQPTYEKVNEELFLYNPLHVILNNSKLAYRIYVILIANKELIKKRLQLEILVCLIHLYKIRQFFDLEVPWSDFFPLARFLNFSPRTFCYSLQLCEASKMPLKRDVMQFTLIKKYCAVLLDLLPSLDMYYVRRRKFAYKHNEGNEPCTHF